jgi:hypothetical protein
MRLADRKFAEASYSEGRVECFPACLAFLRLQNASRGKPTPR